MKRAVPLEAGLRGPIAHSRPRAVIPRPVIYRVIARIPKGRVATYGQIASFAGIPTHARLVGYALSALDDDSRVPWHRVINAAGRVSPRSGESPMATVQRLLLESEGVSFGPNGRIPLRRFQWKPRGSVSPFRPFRDK
jgi:methylated-DNA-protein-cysteine methyltransferase-like protein